MPLTQITGEGVGTTSTTATLAVGNTTITGAATYTTSIKSTTALATPGALSATQATAFASTVSGAAIMGFGTTNDVSLMNRAGTVVLGIGPNTTAVNMTGLLTVSGFGTHSFSAGGTGSQVLSVRNTTAGQALAEIYIGNDASAYAGSISVTSSTYTAANRYPQDGLLIEGNRAGGINIAATGVAGAIKFYSGGTTERMRLLTTGVLGIGTTSAYEEGGRTGLISAGFSFASSWGMYLNETASTSGAGFIIFGLGAGTGTSGIGSITRVGATSAVAYNTSSDRRLKQDLGLASDLSALRALHVHDFTWRGDTSSYLDRGVFAQEAYAAMPRGVTKGDDDPTTVTKAWRVDKSAYVPDLIVGWQQHDKELFDNGVSIITQLAARIAALESQGH